MQVVCNSIPALTHPCAEMMSSISSAVCLMNECAHGFHICNSSVQLLQAQPQQSPNKPPWQLQLILSSVESRPRIEARVLVTPVEAAITCVSQLLPPWAHPPNSWCSCHSKKSSCKSRLLATSHTRLRARDYYTSSTLIGGKGGAGPSSLHTMLEGPMEYVNARWM